MSVSSGLSETDGVAQSQSAYRSNKLRSQQAGAWTQVSPRCTPSVPCIVTPDSQQNTQGQKDAIGGINPAQVTVAVSVATQPYGDHAGPAAGSTPVMRSPMEQRRAEDAGKQFNIVTGVFYRPVGKSLTKRM